VVSRDSQNLFPISPISLARTDQPGQLTTISFRTFQKLAHKKNKKNTGPKDLEPGSRLQTTKPDIRGSPRRARLGGDGVQLEVRESGSSFTMASRRGSARTGTSSITNYGKRRGRPSGRSIIYSRTLVRKHGCERATFTFALKIRRGGSDRRFFYFFFYSDSVISTKINAFEKTGLGKNLARNFTRRNSNPYDITFRPARALEGRAGRRRGHQL